MKHIWIVLLLTSLTAHAFAQPGPGPDQNDAAPIETQTLPPLPLEVQRGTQAPVPFDRVMYVLDVSYSMKSRLAEAITVTDTFCSDGFKASVVTFNSSHAVWDGIPVACQHTVDERCGRNCLEAGWSWMPAHRPQMLQHLQSFTGNGETDPTSALNYAYRNAPAGTLIVFISDGNFSHNQEDGPLSAVRTGQAWRRTQNLAPVQMLVWATSEVDSQRESLVELARLGGSGLWRAERAAREAQAVTRQFGPW